MVGVRAVRVAAAGLVLGAALAVVAPACAVGAPAVTVPARFLGYYYQHAGGLTIRTDGRISVTYSQPGTATPSPLRPQAAPAAEVAMKPAVHVEGRVTGHVRMRDPRWGRLTVITSVTHKPGAMYPGPAHLLVVDAKGRVRLRRDWDWGYAELKPNKPSKDATGNVFLVYNPGRYNGVIVLRAAGGRIEDFGTLPRNSDYMGSGPFGYYAKTVPSPYQRGVLAIRQYTNDCDPSCGSGQTTSRLYVWNGSRYVPDAG